MCLKKGAPEKPEKGLCNEHNGIANNIYYYTGGTVDTMPTGGYTGTWSDTTNTTAGATSWHYR